MQEVNVQVAVRARPLLPKERVAGETVCVRLLPGTNQIVIGRDRVFTFDQVFSAASTQGEVYSRCIEPLVQSCFEGYNATVFAYGQTGSGKTYTIGGGNIFSQTSEETGMVARAIQQIFRMIQSDSSRKFTVKVSYIEIYREELHDLVDLSLNKDLHIREDNHGNTMIVGSAEVECDTADDVMSYLERGSAYRHTGSTQMNEKSSRSHSVFTILIEQRRVSGTGEPMESNSKLDELTSPACHPIENGVDVHYKCAKFHFVDLAGSERAHRTGNVGQRFKESVHINTGLLALGNVISALGDVKRKTTHIPYRDSKITRLLKDSLGGNAKTLMICCISPSSANLDESLNSLKYANRARNIKNKPIVNLDPQSTKIEVMESEIKSLREQLFRATTASTFVRDGETGEDPASNDLRRELEKVHSICMHYRALAEEAYSQLSELRDREFLSDNQNQRLYDYLELMEEMTNNQDESIFERETNVNPVIRRLQRELEQCQRDLQNDAEIFLEKAEEANSIKEKAMHLESDNEELMRRLEDSEDAVNRLKGELLEKQLEMEKLAEKIKEIPVHRNNADASLNMSSPILAPHSSRPGAKSAPLQALNDHSTVKKLGSRNIHTSPPMFTLDHVLHSFRARSQMLINQLEEEDEVLTKNYHSDYDEAEEEAEEDANGKGFKRNMNSRQTYRVKQSHVLSSVSDALQAPLSKPRSSNQLTDGRPPPPTDGAATLRNSVELKQQKLKKNEISLRQSTAKFRNLTINIRMKEQLIRHLVKNEKDALEVNRMFQDKIRILEREKAAAKAELVILQKDFEMKHQQDRALTEQLQSEFRKKMEAAKQKLKSLKSQQKETESMVTLTDNTKKIQDLRMSVSSMQKQQAEIQRQLKDEAELKVILEGDVRQEREELEQMKHQRTTKRDLLTANLRDTLEAGKSVKSSIIGDEQARLEEQRRWLDVEMEKLLEQRRTAEELEKELRQREELLAKKEAMLLEKRELEMKVLRSSQVGTDKNAVRRSPRSDALNTDGVHHQHDEHVNEMRLERERLKQERNSLSTRMQEASGFSTQEQRKLMELEEMIEAMDAALEYKSELISQKQIEMRRSIQSLQSANSALSKLRFLSLSEARSLLARYFEKVVDLRDNQRKLEHHCEELEMAIDEERSVVQELETSLQHSAMETERKLLQQQQEYEHKLQLMMKNLTESELSSRPKIADLEKELYFYKTTCRSLKKHLRDATGASSGSASLSKLGSADENQVSSSHSVDPTRQAFNSNASASVTPYDGTISPRAAPPASLDMAPPANHGNSSARGVARNGGQLTAGPTDGHQLDVDRYSNVSPRAPRVGSPRDAVQPAKTPHNVVEAANSMSAREMTQKETVLRSHGGIRQDGGSDERERSGTHRKTIPDAASVNSSERKTTSRGQGGGHSRKQPIDGSDSSRVQSSPSQEVAASHRSQRPSDVNRQISNRSVVAEPSVKSPRINKTDLSLVDSKAASKKNDSALRPQTDLDRNMTGTDRLSLQDQDRTKLYDSLEN